MSQPPFRASFATCAALTAALASQNTIIVNDGALQAAIDAAVPGDILLVRPALLGFQSLRIDKPLAIHCDVGFRCLSVFVEVSNIPAGSRLVLQGLDASGGSLSVTGCAGSVLLAGLTLASTRPVSVQDCADVAIEDSRLGAGLHAERSVVLVHGSTLHGVDSQAHFSSATTPAVRARDAEVGLSDCVLVGGSQTVSSTAEPSSSALLLESATARLAGTSSLAAGSGLWQGNVDAVAGTGALTHDDRIPLVPLHNGAPIGSGVAGTVLRIPVVSITRSAIGTTTTFTAQGEPGGLFGLALGIPGPRFTVPGIVGAGRIAHFTAMATGSFDGQGSFSFSFPVPDDPILRAWIFRWQAVATVGAQIVWSEPATEAHS